MSEGREGMRSVEELIHENNLSDPGDLDALLELAEITRRAIRAGRCADIELLINYAIRNDRYEAFSWVMAVLQEEFEKKDRRSLKDFTCLIGGSIVNYDEFIRRLRVDLKAFENDARAVTDRNGEVQSFFHIFTYKTAYRNVFLITEETSTQGTMISSATGWSS